MYSLGIRRDFIARHYLVGGDWGPENSPNSHHYVLELQLSGRSLDEHGYLVDIVEVEGALDEVVAHFREKMLNDLPEFHDLNPSLEHFSRIIAVALNEKLAQANVVELKTMIWENPTAWAAFSLLRPQEP